MIGRFFFGLFVAFSLSIGAARADRSSDLKELSVRFIEDLRKSNLQSLKEIVSIELYASIVGLDGQLTEPFAAANSKLKNVGPVSTANVDQELRFSDFQAYRLVVEHISQAEGYKRGSSTWWFRVDEDSRRIVNVDVGPIKSLPAAGGPFVPLAKNGIKQGLRPDSVRVMPHVSPSTGDPSPGIPKKDFCFHGLGPCEISMFPKEPSDREVEFLFATDREARKNTSPIEFVGDRQEQLSYGAVTVRIPEDHRVGKIELPATWKLFGYEIYREKESDKKHFSLRRASIVSEEDWLKIAKEKSADTALVFVHGFNVSFDDAVYRLAQVVWDLQYSGLPVLYAWSSKAGGVADYVYDKESASLAREGFLRVLTKIAGDVGVKRIFVIAHSMGNSIVLDSLPNAKVPVEQLIMAAPDVDRTVFSRSIPKLRKIVGGLTLYASSKDRALQASAMLARFPRAGDVPKQGPVILAGLDTIDVSAIGDEFLGLNHSEFATNRAVMNDIKLLLEDGKRPPRLSEIRQVPERPASPKYWRYAK